MYQHFWKTLALAIVAVALTAGVPPTLHAQERADDHHDQPADHRDDQHRDDQHTAHPDVRRADPADQYRHDHPHASARCHDGFFTTTQDRDHACSKHGGIDVWLVL
jgi:hypothetical protein